ncbi:MAG: SUMF1/EgtB/PvdO family nonheme iron enzyme, partial [Planctomycetaceae bacterium]|nr:SUMF1/EgtB/PvdO family nonheme iron enzyme [Planctomycetaceae bacterium]
DKNGRAKLTDFGLARAGGGSGHSLSGHVLGTEGYMAPEQYADPRQATALSDQYSLAATLYHLVTGRSPRMIHLRLVPEDLQELLATALEESPAKRFSSMEAFQQALGQVARRDKPQPVAATTKPTASETSEGDSNLAKLYVELKKQAEQNVVRAWELYEAYDDEQALTLLRSVPEDLRDVSLEQNVEERLEKGKKLEAEIGQRVRNGRTAGLRALVDQYLKLYPKRKDMISLRAQLPNNETATTQPANADRWSAIAADLLPNGETATSTPTTNNNAINVTHSPKSQPAPFNTVPKPKAGWFASIFGSSSDESKSVSAIAVFDSSAAHSVQLAWADSLERPIEWTNSIGMKFRLIPPGEFMMGAGPGEYGASDDERPQHRVQLTKPFYLGIYPVTQAEYQKLLGTNPSRFTRAGSLPVEQVSWDDAQEFLTALNRKESGKTYRLPTEAQWEYACRAGTTTPFSLGKELNSRQANCDGNNPYGTNIKEKTTPVGEYGANPFGIFDQHGNVWEWCQDWYGSDYYQQFANQIAVDPTGPASGSSRCLRGGSWNYVTDSCRSGCRYYDGPSYRRYDVGFRVLLELS